MGFLFSKPLSKPIYSTPSKNNKNKGISKESPYLCFLIF